jgi:hypothetical protein
MLRADVAGASSRIKSTSREPNRRFGVSVPRQIGTDKRQEDLQPPPSVRENQTGDGFQGVHVEKSKDTGDESMEGAKEAKLSGRGEAHNQGVERLFRNTGLCAGIRPKHRQALNETHESDYYVQVCTDSHRSYERSRSEIWGQILEATAGASRCAKIHRTAH